MVKQFRMKKTFKRLGRSGRRKYGRQMRYNKRGRDIHLFKRTFRVQHSITNTSFISIPSNGATYNTYLITDVPNSSDFGNLYDTYKICGIKQKFIYDKNSADSDVAQTSTIPNLITINDFNDISALASVNEALEYASCKITRLDKPTKRYFRPTQDILNPTTDPSSDNVVKSRWNEMNLNSGRTPKHHGLKVLVEVPNSVGVDPVEIGKLTVYTTYYLAMRTPK